MIQDSAYIIVSGVWFPVANAGTVNLAVRENKVESFALNGARRILVPENSSGARSWEVNCSPVPAKWADSVGVLKTLSDRGTVVSWVPPLARYSNMLFQSWNNGDRVLRTNGGYLGEGSSVDGGAQTGFAPVMPGERYCFSVATYTTASAVPSLQFFSAGKTQVGASVPMRKKADDGVRVYEFATAPVNAVYARIATPKGNVFFAPAITMGETLNPYSLPGSCESAVVSLSGLQHGRLRSSRSFSFTVREV